MDQPLLGRYLLYKASTKRFLDWLVDAAARCGNPLPANSHTAPAGQASSSQSGERISTRQIISSAQAISDSALPVPQSVIRLLEEVIEGRQACTDWYALQPLTEKLARENEGHVLFINALGRVLEILRPNVRVEDKPNKEATKAKSKKKRSLTDLGCDFNNLFAQLELEEPSDSPLGQAPISVVSIEISEQETTIGLDDQAKDDAAFRLFCFLEDARDVRKFIKDSWHEYEQGDLSLAGVASMTEVGIGLLRISSAAFVAANSAFADWSHLLNYFGLEQQVIHRPYETPFIYLHPREAASSPKDQISAVDLADLLCPAAAYHLEQLKTEMDEEVSTRNLSELGKGQQYVSGMVFNRDMFNFPGDIMKRCVLQLLTWQFSPDLQKDKIGDANEKGTFHSSEVIEGILRFHRTRHLPPWLPIAFQVYCEIYEIVGSDPARMANEYIDKVAEMKGIIKRQKEIFDDAYTTKFWKKHLDHLDWVHETLSFHLRADTEQMRRRCRDGLKSKDGQPLVCILGLPCIVGTHLYRYTMAFHHAGIASATYGNIITVMAHLYTTGRKLGLINSDWQDMEMVMAAQKSIEPLVTKGNGKTDALSCLKQFLLAFGAPMTGFANNKMPDFPTKNQVIHHAKRPVSTPKMPKVSDEIAKKEEKLGTWRGELIELMLTSLTVKANQAQTQGGKKKDKKSQSTPAGHFTPLQLLSTFKKTFLADEPMLNFDFFSFTYDCVLLLHSITSRVEPMLRETEHLKEKDTAPTSSSSTTSS